MVVGVLGLSRKGLHLRRSTDTEAAVEWPPYLTPTTHFAFRGA